MNCPDQRAIHPTAYIKLLYLRNLTSRICLLACAIRTGHGNAKESPASGDQVDLSA